MKSFDVKINLSSSGKSTSALLNCYIPDTQSIRKEAVLICPGGGYAMCSDREGEPIALQFLAKGIACFVLYYSVAPNRFPTQINEVATAVSHIKANAEKYNIDADKIYICGFSAGGHLAGHYSVLSGENYFSEKLGGTYDDYSVAGAILSYPVITADTAYSHGNSFINLLGEENIKNKDSYSVDKLVTKSTPKMFIWHTFEDNLVNVMNSILLAQKLVDNNIPIELHVYTKGGHGLSLANELVNRGEDFEVGKTVALRTQDWIKHAIEWINE